MEDLKLTNTPVDKSEQRDRHVQWFLLTSAQYLGLVESEGQVQITRQKPAVELARPGRGAVYADQYTRQPESVLCTTLTGG